MLVLDRKVGQQVLIGKGMIEIKILRIQDDIISIGFSAPSNIDIDRKEIYLKKLARNFSSLNGAYV